MIFPLEFLLNLLRAGSIRTHESQQPLLQVGRGAEDKRKQHRCYTREIGNKSLLKYIFIFLASTDPVLCINIKKESVLVF